jgi:hypothetical protein
MRRLCRRPHSCGADRQIIVGVGIDKNIVLASSKAVASNVNRALKRLRKNFVAVPRLKSGHAKIPNGWRIHLVPKLIGQKKFERLRCKFATFFEVAPYMFGQSSPISGDYHD